MNRPLAFAVLMALSASAIAQSFPSKPIRVKAEVERWTRVVSKGGIKPE